MLYLGNLPLRVGAFHPLGTNDIVLNKRLFKTLETYRDKANVFTTLLHEYLHTLGYTDEMHTLGYTDEKRVRQLVYWVCSVGFDGDPVVMEAAVSGPWGSLREVEEGYVGLDLELVRDFEEIEGFHIV